MKTKVIIFAAAISLLYQTTARAESKKACLSPPSIFFHLLNPKGCYKDNEKPSQVAQDVLNKFYTTKDKEHEDVVEAIARVKADAPPKGTANSETDKAAYKILIVKLSKTVQGNITDLVGSYEVERFLFERSVSASTGNDRLTELNPLNKSEHLKDETQPVKPDEIPKVQQ